MTAPSCAPGSGGLRRRVPGHRPRPGPAAAGARRRRPRPGRRRRPGPEDLRLPRRRGPRHPRLPDAVPPRDGRPGRSSRCSDRRFGPRLLAASRRIAARLPLTGASTPATCRRSAPSRPSRPGGRGRVEVITYDTERAEAEQIADLLRRAHLEDGVPWSEMAVLVRSGRTSIPVLRRGARRRPACPSRWPATRSRWCREPAVRPCSTHSARWSTSTTTTPTRRLLDPVAAEGSLISPLAGLDAADVRALSRALRAATRRRPGRGRPPRPSPRAAARGGARRAASSRRARSATTRRRAGRPCAPAAPRHAVLEPAARPRRRSGRSGRAPAGPAAARAASSAAVRAARLRQPRPRRRSAPCSRSPPGPRSSAATPASRLPREIEAQQIPADTLADRGVRGDAVRLLTAHRSKGLEWRLVVVARVQEGPGPTCADAARCCRPTGWAPTGYAVPVSSPRPRRASCSPRSAGSSTSPAPAPGSGWSSPRSQSPEDDGDQPSRLLDELRPLRRRQPPHRSSAAPLSLAGLVERAAPTSPTPRCPSRCGARRPPGWPGWQPSASADGGRWSRPRTRPAGGDCDRSHGERARCDRPTSRSRCRPARWRAW